MNSQLPLVPRAQEPDSDVLLDPVHRLCLGAWEQSEQRWEQFTFGAWWSHKSFVTCKGNRYLGGEVRVGMTRKGQCLALTTVSRPSWFHLPLLHFVACGSCPSDLSEP